MTKEELKQRVYNACECVRSAEGELTEIDAKFGDADHGYTMSKIVNTIEKTLKEADGNIKEMHSFPFVVMMSLRVAAALVRFEVENMALDHTGIPLDFDFPALLAYEGGLIPVLREKQPYIIAGAAVGTGTLNRKLDHPAGCILKTLYGQDIVSFQLTG